MTTETPDERAGRRGEITNDPGPTDPPTAPIRVLLVDDSADYLDALAATLAGRYDDIEIATATSAPDAFTVLGEKPVDCIVSDYRMPAVDGLEFLSAVREEHPDTSFIMFTNKGTDAVADTAAQIGAADYVRKAGDVSGTDRLVTCIRDAVGGPAQQGR